MDLPLKKVTTPRSDEIRVWKLGYSKSTVGHIGNIIVKLVKTKQIPMSHFHWSQSFIWLRHELWRFVHPVYWGRAGNSYYRSNIYCSYSLILLFLVWVEYVIRGLRKRTSYCNNWERGGEKISIHLPHSLLFRCHGCSLNHCTNL